MTMTARYPNESKNPYVSGSHHWNAWEVISYNPKVFFISRGNSTYQAALSIKREDMSKLIKLLMLIGLDIETIRKRCRYFSSHVSALCDPYLNIVALPEKDEKLFRKHLAGLQALQEENSNG